jgi:thioredoxin
LKNIRPLFLAFVLLPLLGIAQSNQPQSKKEMSEEEYKMKVNSHPIVLIDYSAVWCAPCVKLSPIVEKIGKERAKDVKVYKIDVDENRTIALNHGIDELPTLLWYKNGKVAMRMIGFHSEKLLIETLDGLLKK